MPGSYIKLHILQARGKNKMQIIEQFKFDNKFIMAHV